MAAMALCSACSTIDFDSCFPGRPKTGLAMMNSMEDVQHVLDNRETCGMCHLVSRAIERYQPQLFQPQYRNRKVGWFDQEMHDSKIKILQIQTDAYFFDFNWIQDASQDPAPGRARDLSSREQSPEGLIQLLRSWLSTCKANHAQCRHVWSQKTVQDLRLRFIDTERWCLVTADQVPPTKCQYAALSYVWGTKPTVTTTSSNLSQFSREGGLRKAGLPSTIEDSIRLVHDLGVPYLWVDALCIVQSGGTAEKEKARQIQNMDAVYGFADFTVVQATGDDSSSPLHGFATRTDPSTSPSPAPQIQAEVKPGLRLALQSHGFDTYQKAACKWITRAWTFQEAVLSARLLIWHNGSVTWECREAVWCEDVVPGLATSLVKPQFGSQMLPFQADRQAAEEKALETTLILEPKNKHHNISMYEGAVEEYTSREMGFWSDKLNAFAGIGAVFERQMGMDLRYGLPRDQLDTALLWSAAKGPLERLYDFPSWSWSGWKGAVRYGSNNPLLISPLAAFYGIHDGTGDSHGEHEPAESSLVRLEQAWEAETYVVPRRPWRVHKPSASPSAQHLPHLAIPDLPPATEWKQSLCLQTFTTPASRFIFIDGKVLTKESKKTVGAILLDQGRLPDDYSTYNCVVLNHCTISAFAGPSDPRPELDNPQAESFPDGVVPCLDGPDIHMIRGTTSFGQPLSCVRFLLVEKRGNGTAERRGMGEIRRTALNKAGVKWEWVFLV